MLEANAMVHLSNDQLKYHEDIVGTFDRIIAEGPWEKSLFLKGIRKKLEELRQQYLEDLGFELPELAEAVSAVLDTQANAVKEEPLQEIFISLYNADGNNIKKWEILINGLNRQIISRPILAREEDAQSLIRAKANLANEAYVILRVPKKDILPLPSNFALSVGSLQGKIIKVREGSLKIENIIKFVHVSGNYTFQAGRLHLCE